jgi:hypothetical protein
MDEHDVMKRQVKEPERTEEATERLARLHCCKAELQSSPGMEMLENIAADAILRFERVARAATAYRKTAHGGMKKNDPLTAYVQAMLARVETDKRSGNTLLASHKKEADGLRLLNVNHFIQESVQMLRRMVKNRVKLHVVPADRDVRVMADWEKMRQVLASIVAYGSEIIWKGGTITLLARLLPIENDLLEKGEGRCALLSVTSTDVAAERSGHKGIARENVRRVFRAIRAIIEKHNGSIRTMRQRGKAQFNIYLPVLQGT